jgi:hypothetical protein
MSDDRTPRWGSGPDVYLMHTREVLAAARAQHATLTRLIGRAELLEVGLTSWRTGYVAPEDRARDIDAVFKLREDAKKAGVIE